MNCPHCDESIGDKPKSGAPKVLNPDQETEVVRMYVGMNTQQIAQHFGVDIRTIQRTLRRELERAKARHSLV